MAQVTLRINGYAYTLGCQDGEEDHLQAMAAEVDQRIDSVKASAGPSGEARMLVIAALLMADELHDQSRLLERLKADLQQGSPADTRRLAMLADRAEEIAADLEQ